MNYQIYLTEKCTRKCSFCNVQQNEYVESIDNIHKFISTVKSEHHQFDNFSIDLFGGEPLINISAIKLIVEQFNDWCCKINLVTNADLLDKYINESFLSRLDIAISAYDIFNDLRKYQNILRNVNSKSLSFQYTFSQNDNNKLYKFVDICNNQLKSKYKIILSHNPNSWNNLTVYELYDMLYAVYDKLFLDFYDRQSYSLPSALEQHFKRYVQLLFDPDVKDFYCFQNDKKVFYHGKFIDNACIRISYKTTDIIDTPKRCTACAYRNICAKSCVAEYVNYDVPEKLCVLNKVIFDVINDNINRLKDDQFVNSLLRVYYDEMKCH